MKHIVDDFLHFCPGVFHALLLLNVVSTRSFLWVIFCSFVKVLKINGDANNDKSSKDSVKAYVASKLYF